MKQLRRTVILLIILCMGTCFAYAQKKGSTLSASTVFGSLDSGEASQPKAKLGVSLKKNGFTFESETQKKENIYGEIKTLHTKIYKKGDFSIEYTYYMDSENDPFFLSLKIKFPTTVACESFYKEVVKRVKDDEKYWDNVPGGFPRGE